MKSLIVWLALCVFSTSSFAQETIEDQVKDVLMGDCDAALFIDFGLSFERTDKIVRSRGLTLKQTNTTPVDTLITGIVLHRVGIWENTDGSVTLMVIFDELNTSWFVTLTIQTPSEYDARKLAKQGKTTLSTYYVDGRINGLFAKNCGEHVMLSDISNADEHLFIVLARKKP